MWNKLLYLTEVIFWYEQIIVCKVMCFIDFWALVSEAMLITRLCNYILLCIIIKVTIRLNSGNYCCLKTKGRVIVVFIIVRVFRIHEKNSCALDEKRHSLARGRHGSWVAVWVSSRPLAAVGLAILRVRQLPQRHVEGLILSDLNVLPFCYIGPPRFHLFCESKTYIQRIC